MSRTWFVCTVRVAPHLSIWLVVLWRHGGPPLLLTLRRGGVVQSQPVAASRTVAAVESMRSLWLVVALVCMAVVGARAAQCNCNCPRNMPVCGKDSTGDVDTFPSECALRCFNCTFGRDYFVTKRGACSAMDHRRGRRSAPVWTRRQGPAPSPRRA